MWPSKPKPSDIFQTLKFYLILANVLMISPYAVRGRVGSRKIAVAKYTDLYLPRCLITIIFSVYVLIPYSEGVSYLKIAQAVLNVAALCSCIIWKFINRHFVAEMLKDFGVMEAKFDMRIRHDRKKLKKIIVMSVVFLVFVMGFSIYTLFTEKQRDVLRNLVLFYMYIVPNIITLLYLSQFFIYVVVIHDWISSLGHVLEDALQFPSRIAMELIFCRKCYDSIWNLAKKVEAAYQLPVLVILVASFLNITVFSYWFMKSQYITPSTYLAMFSNVCKITVLPIVCEMCRSKTHRISVLLQRISARNFDTGHGKIQISTVELSSQMSHQKMSFFVAKMFPLDLNFIFSVAAAVTIYVVIFLQNNVMA